jgi:hypothetical protein
LVIMKICKYIANKTLMKIKIRSSLNKLKKQGNLMNNHKTMRVIIIMINHNNLQITSKG